MQIFSVKMDCKSEDFNFEQIRESPPSHRTPRSNRIENLETENLVTEMQNNIYDVPTRRDTMLSNTKLFKNKLFSLSISLIWFGFLIFCVIVTLLMHLLSLVISVLIIRTIFLILFLD